MPAATTADRPVATQRHEATVTLVLNQPERRNALSTETMRELTARLREAGDDPGVRVVVLGAEGTAFSAGHDLRELSTRDPEVHERVFAACAELMMTIHRLPVPVVARVQGMATAAGCQLVAACDLAVAAEGARFATPGVRIGLFCTTPMVALSRAVGRKRALQMLLTGEQIDARTAVEWGLVNSVVPAAELRDETRKLAARIVEASPVTLAIGKQAFYSQIDLDQPKAYAYAKEIMSMNSMAVDAQEGISAFLGKRAACWTGR
jgi:enoyl-CoA hydratase/carnithine racemase